jgi:multiple sugar transport system permease protein
LPWVISQTVVALLWTWMFNPLYGVLNYLLSFLGFQAIDITNRSIAMPFLIFANVWRSYPLPMILLFAAMQSISEELYDAAKIDGANAFKRFLHITLPSIKGTSLVTIITLTIFDFNMVTLIYIMTGGGPGNQTTTLSLRAFKTAFEQWDMSLASAISVIILLFNLIFSLVYLRITKVND